MLAHVSLKLTGPLDHLRLIWQTGEALLESVSFDEDPEGTRYHVLLAVQEMVTNVLRHAYSCDESRPLEVHFTVSEDRFDIALCDEGPPFDPLAFEPEVGHLEHELPDEAGGLGIHITRMVMDDCEYERRGRHNWLHMTKYARTGSGVHS